MVENIDLDNGAFEKFSGEEIIRIEKKLKAEMKLNQSLDLNQIELILHILKNHQTELKILFTPRFTDLVEILKIRNGFYLTDKEGRFTFTDEENISEFVTTFFSRDLSAYAAVCMAQDHYRGLHTLLLYAEILPVSVKDEISKKCLLKIEFWTECIKINASQLKEKIRPVMNPFFYRCLNQLGVIQFESAVINLYNTNLSIEYRHKSLFMRIVFSMGFLKVIRQDFRESLERNHNTARIEGVCEVEYGETEEGQKGGTFVIKKELLPPVPDYLTAKGPKPMRPRERSQTGIKYGYNNGEKKINPIAVIAVSGIMFLLVFLFGGQPNSEREDLLFDFKIPEINIPPSFSKPKAELNIVADDSVMFGVNDKAVLMQTGDFEIRKVKNIEFDIDKTNLTSLGDNGFGIEARYINLTDQPVIIVFLGWYCIFIDAGESCFASLSSRFVVYTGSDPQMITYKNSEGEIKKDFRFGSFSERDSKILHRIYEFGLIDPRGGYKVEIGNTNYPINISLRDTTKLGF